MEETDDLLLSYGINPSTTPSPTPSQPLMTKVSPGRRTNKWRNVRSRQDEMVDSSIDGSALLACFVCGKNFVSYRRLKSHEKTHSKSRPFKCMDCGKTFTVRYSLICHTRVHTRERPYQCTVCGSTFSQASSLKTHQIYKHTKEFPYICKYCGRGFISPGQRHEHINRAHLKSSSSSSSSSSSLGGINRRPRKINSPGHLHQQQRSAPQMASTSVQTQLSLPPGPLYD